MNKVTILRNYYGQMGDRKKKINNNSNRKGKLGNWNLKDNFPKYNF